MNRRYLLELAGVAAAIFMFGITFHQAEARGEHVVALLAVLAFGYALVVGWAVLRQAHADWLCYALTGQRMPPLRQATPETDRREDIR